MMKKKITTNQLFRRNLVISVAILSLVSAAVIWKDYSSLYERYAEDLKDDLYKNGVAYNSEFINLLLLDKPAELLNLLNRITKTEGLDSANMYRNIEELPGFFRDCIIPGTVRRTYFAIPHCERVEDGKVQMVQEVSQNGIAYGYLLKSKSLDVPFWSTAQTIVWECFLAILTVTVASIFGLYQRRKLLIEPLEQLAQNPKQLLNSNEKSDYELFELSSLAQALKTSYFELASFQKKEIQFILQKEVTKQSGQVAHDIMATVSGLALALKRAPLEASQKEQMLASLFRIEEIVNRNLKQLSQSLKMEGHSSTQPVVQDEVHQASASLGAALSTAISDTTPLAEERQVKVIGALPRFLYTSFASINYFDLYPVFTNLLKNAIEALSEKRGGTISITANRMEGTVEIVIKDTGPGFSPQILSAFGNKAGTSTKPDGHGMGLWGAQRAMSQCNGKISIENSSDGAVVTLRFGIAPSPNWFYDISKLESAPIVVSLDDDPEVQTRLEAMFPSSRLLKTNTEAQFTAFLLEHPNALYLIDLDFGGEIDGVTLIQKYSLVQKAILVSGRIWSDTELMKKASAIGIKMFPKDCIPSLG